ncbi:S-formylglutathione hydrolase [Roseateles oligotrophus]|uniref:S-formylglutathione hydrolase n=1 Tax=Roseateles oligotrophus TaxID=1769250 RepID=A0ABT2YDD8_9BURK|nr:S-formylglutathione hydrolase [Roseateles oligotrophus]MCV2368041.1 S-formylglutathione hydrolase [Roseateles oligotrophus]
MKELELLGEHACFGGRQRFYRHASREIGLSMRFGLFLPPEPRALLVYLAGLTCSEETFAIKAGAQRLASELGMALLTPDTSPRGVGIAGESDSWDFGVGAGFYLDASQPPWASYWRMESYLMHELLPAVQQQFNLGPERSGVFGHSMGGHGALTLALRHPGAFRSVSAFAPVCAPLQCPWGQKAFAGYLGRDHADWAGHDASALMLTQTRPPFPAGILIDQGLADPFLATQLMPEAFEAACLVAGQDLTLRRHAAYDHGYYFIASFVEDHLRHHAAQLLG